MYSIFSEAQLSPMPVLGMALAITMAAMVETYAILALLITILALTSLA